MLNLIDVSSHQKGLNIEKIDGDGVVVKATEGKTYVNPLLDQHVKQTLGSRKVLGLYHYARGNNPAQVEAEFFLKSVGEYLGTTPLFLDFEEVSMFNAAGVQWAKKWLDSVYQKIGVKPMVYLSLSVENSLNWSSIVNSNYGLWLAQYNKEKQVSGYKHRNLYGQLKYWPGMAMFQYTSVGRLSGWSGDLDFDVFYGDRKAWSAYGYAQKQSINQNWHQDKGVFVVGRDQTINLRTAPVVGASVIALMQPGDKVSYDAWTTYGGYLWIRQPRSNNQYGYLATGEHDGISRTSLWGSGIN